MKRDPGILGGSIFFPRRWGGWAKIHVNHATLVELTRGYSSKDDQLTWAHVPIPPILINIGGHMCLFHPFTSTLVDTCAYSSYSYLHRRTCAQFLLVSSYWDVSIHPCHIYIGGHVPTHPIHINYGGHVPGSIRPMLINIGCDSPISSYYDRNRWTHKTIPPNKG